LCSSVFNLFFEEEPFTVTAILIARGTMDVARNLFWRALLRPTWPKFEDKGREQEGVLGEGAGIEFPAQKLD